MTLPDMGNRRIRKIDASGIITTVAGNSDGDFCSNTNGMLATDFYLAFPRDVTIDSEGNLLIATSGSSGYTGCDGEGGNGIFRVNSSGAIFALTGVGEGYSGDGGPATSAELYNPVGIDLDPQGHIYIADSGNYVVRKINVKSLPSFSGEDLAIVSDDGTQLYQFDYTGKHLNTLHTLTGATLLSFGYDADGLLTSLTNGDGQVTTIERDGDGMATAIVAPYGQKTTLKIIDDYLESLTNPENEETSFTYYPGGLLSTLTNPRSYTTTFTFDSDGNLKKDLDPLGGFIELTAFELDNGHRVELTTAMGRTESYGYEVDTDGTIQRTAVDRSGLTTQTYLRTDGTGSMTSPNGMLYAWQSSPDPRFGMETSYMTSFTRVTPSGLTSVAINSREVTLSDESNPLSIEEQKTTVTINGRTFISQYNGSTKETTTTSAEGRHKTVIYDGQGRIAQGKINGLEPVQFIYDSSGRLSTVTIGTTSPRISTLAYNPEGYLKNLTDPLGHTVSYTYDNAGRVLTQTLNDGDLINFIYDDSGNLTSIIPPAKPAHDFVYNEVNLVDSYLAPDIGLAGNTTTYDYNLDHQIELITRSNGSTIDLEYDTGGRLKTVATSRGITTYSYDSATGKLITITAPGGEILNYTYDGVLPLTTTWSGTVSGSVTKGYDHNFWVISQSVNGSDAINYVYDDDALLTNTGDLILTRDPNHGLITAAALGLVTSNLEYTSFGELQGQTVQYNGTNYYSVTYTRDFLGRIEAKSETIQGESHTYGYAYDDNGRLDTVTLDGTLTRDYGYDSNGNRDDGTYDDQDRLLTYGSNTFAYTDNGELLTKSDEEGTTTYTYDSLGNLTHVLLPDGDTIEYVIDGANRRVGKKYNGTLINGYLYENKLRIIAELNGSDSSVASRFIYGSKSNVPDYMVKNGTRYRIVSDHLGSIRLVIDTSDGSIDQRLDYDEFGNVIMDTNPGFQPFGFAGGLYDKDTKLVRFGSRDYDPEVGRWTAKDPILFKGGNSNLYSYVGQDPINHIDPWGLCDDWIINTEMSEYYEAYLNWIFSTRLNWGPLSNIMSIFSDAPVCFDYSENLLEYFNQHVRASCCTAEEKINNPGMPWVHSQVKVSCFNSYNGDYDEWIADPWWDTWRP